ncbi:type II secretion system F family protein [Methanosphaera sp. ISO3-F5]|uniref:type II secretion system F family protein n=1 Tax=Methanosphaera sp. ISO3-F5 TaxID=1452353 RepID=UPI002B259B4B|nr:type II secretion system F family protein [Methanosphaera sp. ISO3-F5]WQH64573.1 type II secretion system F family protein [Methanosphaera sp. ISO3-F5]
MYNKIIKKINNHIKNRLSEETIYKIQRKLIDSGIFIKTEELITITILTMLITLIITTIICIIFTIHIITSIIITLTIPLSLTFYIYYKNEKRLEEIEQELPDYLRQISSLIKVGLGLESAFKELSQTINNSLNDEIKRALLETSFGRPFDESLMEIANKNNSDNLKHTFQLIIHSWNSGGNLSEILEAIADDLSDTIMLKKQRKAGVMMSVMFLVISSVIATPFALGMIQLYTQFISISGRTNPLSEVIPISSTGYIIIQAILVSILLGIVMYSDAKKGIKYMIIIVPASLAVYYFSQQILTGIMGGII